MKFVLKHRRIYRIKVLKCVSYFETWCDFLLLPVLRAEMLFVYLALQPIVVVFSTARLQALASSCSRFLDHTQRRATVGRTPLDE
jgi:hypothetical protein